MSAAAVAKKKRRILVVDNIELNRVLTEAALRGTYEVDTVDGAAAALRALEIESYDLVLMDLEMPGSGGHEAAATIRRDTARPVRLAAISLQNDAAARLRSAGVGMAAHIDRTIAPHQLLKEIERVFSRPCEGDHARPDCWQMSMYEDWVSRLGEERMKGFLSKLHEQFRNLLLLIVGRGEQEALHRRAHDVASTAGMLGFNEVTRSCRALLEAGQAAGGSIGIGDCAHQTLADELQRAIARLDRHLAPRPVATAA